MIEKALDEAYDYVEALLRDRRAHPSDDLVSNLLAAEDAGERLSHNECVNLVLNVLAGGVDTTQSQLAHGIRLLADHPDQWALLEANPELAPKAVEEILRMEPITPFTARICTDDLKYRGVTFPANTIVAICAERANMEAGEMFDITADRFLHHMVRFLVGTMLEVGEGKRDPGVMAELLEQKDNSQVSQPVPPHALFLERVEYPKDLYLERA